MDSYATCRILVNSLVKGNLKMFRSSSGEERRTKGLKFHKVHSYIAKRLKTKRHLLIIPFVTRHCPQHHNIAAFYYSADEKETNKELRLENVYDTTNYNNLQSVQHVMHQNITDCFGKVSKHNCRMFPKMSLILEKISCREISFSMDNGGLANVGPLQRYS